MLQSWTALSCEAQLGVQLYALAKDVSLLLTAVVMLNGLRAGCAVSASGLPPGALPVRKELQLPMKCR